MITRVLKQIDPDDYVAAIDKTLAAKWKGEREKDPLKKKFKVMRYMISRGFEPDLVNDSLSKLMEE